MTQSRFFQLSLSLPVITWGISLILFLFVFKQTDREILNDLLNGYRILVPYIIFAGMLWRWVKNKPYSLLVLTAWVSPIIWGCFFALYYLTAFYIIDRAIFVWPTYAIMAFWAMVVAYLFEIIPFIILVAFKDDFRPVSVSPPTNSGVAEPESSL